MLPGMIKERAETCNKTGSPSRVLYDVLRNVLLPISQQIVLLLKIHSKNVIKIYLQEKKRDEVHGRLCWIPGVFMIIYFYYQTLVIDQNAMILGPV